MRDRRIDTYRPIVYTGGMRPKRATSVRLSDDARAMIDGLAAALGVSRTAVLELAVRELAARHRLPVDGTDASVLRRLEELESAERMRRMLGPGSS